MTTSSTYVGRRLYQWCTPAERFLPAPALIPPTSDRFAEPSRTLKFAQQLTVHRVPAELNVCRASRWHPRMAVGVRARQLAAETARRGRKGRHALCAPRAHCICKLLQVAGPQRLGPPSRAAASRDARRLVDAPPMPLCQRGAVAAVASRDRRRAIGADRRACADRMLMGPRWHSMSGIGLAVGDLRCGMVLLASWHQTSGVGLVPWTAPAVCWLSCAACVVHVAMLFCHRDAFCRCASVTICMLNERIHVRSINADSLSVQTDTRPTQAVTIDSTTHTLHHHAMRQAATSRARNLRPASAAGARTAELHGTSSRQQQR